MKKKIIFWIAASVPCKKIPHAGGQTFRYYFNQFVADDRFDVKLIGFADGMSKEVIEDELKGIDHRIVYKADSFKKKIKKLTNLESQFNPWNRYAGILSNYYASETMKYLKEYKSAGVIPKYVILEWTGLVLMALEIKKIFPECHLIASEHDVTFVGYERKSKYYTGVQGLKWKQKYRHEKKIELRALSLCDLILPHNPDNCKILIDEGIKVNKVQWLAPYFNNMKTCQRNSNHRDILFFGAMARPENSLSAMWFIDYVFPKLKDLDIRFVILGSNPPSELKELESDKIHITGFVDSIEPYFEEAMCLVAPLVLGAGIKVKVLEALSSGIPVLTNAIGIEGIPATDGRDYLHCDKPEDYEKTIRKIYSGEIDVNKLEKNTRVFMTRYSLEESKKLYIENMIKIGEAR